MNDETEFAFRKLEVAYVAAQQRDGRIRGEVGTLARKPLWVTGQDGGPRTELERPICVAEALHQPATEKAGAAGKERRWPRRSSHKPGVWAAINSRSLASRFI